MDKITELSTSFVDNSVKMCVEAVASAELASVLVTAWMLSGSEDDTFAQAESVCIW